MAEIGLPYDCPRCGTRHLVACCHASRHNLCDGCVREQHTARAIAAQPSEAAGTSEGADR